MNLNKTINHFIPDELFNYYESIDQSLKLDEFLGEIVKKTPKFFNVPVKIVVHYEGEIIESDGDMVSKPLHFSLPDEWPVKKLSIHCRKIDAFEIIRKEALLFYQVFKIMLSDFLHGKNKNSCLFVMDYLLTRAQDCVILVKKEPAAQTYKIEAFNSISDSVYGLSESVKNKQSINQISTLNDNDLIDNLKATIEKGTIIHGGKNTASQKPSKDIQYTILPVFPGKALLIIRNEYNGEEEKTIDFYRKIFENSGMITLLIRIFDKKIVAANKRAILFYGYNKQEIMKKTIDQINIGGSDFVREKMADAFKNREASYLFKHRTKNNGVKLVKVYTTPIRINKNNHLLSFITDITERKVIQDNLERMSFSIENISEMVFWISDDGRIEYANNSACKALGIPKDQLSKYSLLKFIPQYPEIFWKHIYKKDKKNNTVETEIQGIYGNRIPVGMFFNSFVYDQEEFIFIYAHDITEKRKMELKLIQSILETEEKERTRFSRDLHDGLGSLLSSIKLYIDLLDSDKFNKDKKSELIFNAKELIKEAISSSKEIAYDLQPSILRDFGLKTAMESMVKKINFTSHFKIILDQENIEENIPDRYEAVIYRLIKELLNNTIKYANAKIVHISIIRYDQYINIHYSDDGIGFDLNEILSGEKKGMGLSNIFSRISSLQGIYDLKSKQNNGMVMDIEIPLYQI